MKGTAFRRTCLLLLILIGVLAGCARRRPIVALPPDNANPRVPVPDTKPDSTPARQQEVVVLFSSGPTYADVAGQLKRLLPSGVYRPILVDLQNQATPRILDPVRNRQDVPIVAIGLTAARYARDFLRGPVVFAQVFNYQELLESGRTMRGVAPMPPFSLLLEDWKKIDPKLRRVGLIVGDGHDTMMRDIESAGQAAGLTVERQNSGSDQETLYVFKRLAPRLDGLLLVPDDRILSPNVLRDLLEYAVSHGVRVCVFSEDLLPWGALMSAKPSAETVARGIRRVLEDMTAGKAAGPSITPLSENSILINQEIADRFGLPSRARSSSVVRGDH